MDGSLRALTDRQGPDQNPVVSPDGNKIAYLGFDDQLLGFQITRLYVMNRDGSGKTVISGDLDRDVRSPIWEADGDGLFFQYDDHGRTKVAQISLDGNVRDLVDDLGGVSLGRPYAGDSFTVANNGRFAYTRTDPSSPADVAAGQGAGNARRLTRLNEDLFGHKTLGWSRRSGTSHPTTSGGSTAGLSSRLPSIRRRSTL